MFADIDDLSITINEQKGECTKVSDGPFFFHRIGDGWKTYFPSFDKEPEETFKEHLVDGVCLMSFFENDGCVRCYNSRYVFDLDECYNDYDACASKNRLLHEGVCLNVSDNPEFNCSGFIYEVGVMNFNDCFKDYDSCFSFISSHESYMNASCVNVSKIHPRCKGYAYMEDNRQYASCYTYDQCREECFFAQKEYTYNYKVQTPFGECNLSRKENSSKDCCNALGLIYVENVDSTKSISFRNIVDYFNFLNDFLIHFIVIFVIFIILSKIIKGKFLFPADPFKKILIVSLFLGIISALVMLNDYDVRWRVAALNYMVLLPAFPLIMFFSWLKHTELYFSGIFASKIFLWIVFFVIVGLFTAYYYYIIKRYYLLRKHILEKYNNPNKPLN